MAIISRNKQRKLRYGSNQLRYAVVYIALTVIVMLFLNFYCSWTSQQLFYRSKHTAMMDKLLHVSSALGQEEVLNADTARSAVGTLGNLKTARLVVTDDAGRTLYDSAGDSIQYCLFPEVVQALRGNDVITIDYRDGVMTSRAAAPILSYGKLTGCAYILEYDTAQGQLIHNLQMNILTVSLIVIGIVAAFSIVNSNIFTRRLRQIMASIRVIREGDYSHKVRLGGHDELTVLAQEFNDLTDRLCQSEEMRRQFVSDASHELKTPLASIKLLSDSILQNDMDVDTVREFVADIGDEADRLTRMSGKLLSLTKFHPETGSDCEITYFRPTIERVRRMLSTIADMACVELRTEILRDSSILIMEDDLYQIIFNLVENGIKYNLPGGTLTIRLTRMADKAVLTIRDTGMGIPADSLDKIFDRFYRVDKARSRQSGGSGLGLAIVKEMVERNHGTIAVYSSDEPPTGTVFTLVFPAFDVEVTE